MRRSVLRVGKSSLAVSLPKAFVDVNNLGSGEEIEVEHRGNSLIVRCEESKDASKEIDISEMRTTAKLDKILDRVLAALFKQGFNQFTLKCNERQAKEIRKILQNGKLYMYEEPTPEDNNKIKIYTSISAFDKTALDNLTKVAIKEIYKNLEEFIKLVEIGCLTKENAEKICARDKMINEQTDICKRIINKNITDHRSTSMYLFVDDLERIGDYVKYLINYSLKTELSELHIEIARQLQEYFYLLLSAKNNFSAKKIDEFYARFDELLELINNCQDSKIYFYFRSMMNLIRSAYTSLTILNL